MIAQPVHEAPKPWFLVGLSLFGCVACGPNDSRGSDSLSADAGPDQEVVEGTPVRLDGSGSYVPDILAAYLWSQLSGESVALDDVTAERPSFQAPAVLGRLVFALKVSDAGSSAQDTMEVRVGGRELEPVAKKVQMHLHAHSNHNGAVQPASMQWHSAWAHMTSAADVLWWSDHAASFEQGAPVLIDFAAGDVDPTTLVVRDLQANPLDPALSFTHLEPRITGAAPCAHIDGAGLHVALTAGQGAEWETFEYLSRSALPEGAGFQSVRDMRFNRPISSSAKIVLEADFGPIGPDTRYELVAALAWHQSLDSIQHRLVFRFVAPAEVTPPEVIGEDEVIVRVPWSAIGHYTLDLLGAGLALLDGDDNTLSEVRLRVSARNGSTASATWGSLDLVSDAPDAEQQLDSMELLSSRYQARYGLVEHIGFEQHHSGELHMNALLPDGARTLEVLAPWSTPSDTRAWVQSIHEKGGLVSWNHPFGTSSWTELSPETERPQRVRALAQYLLDNQAFGADLLEVGYLNRGGMDLHDHLDLWDILLANRLFLKGVGVSDSHGGKWATWQGPSSFTTWVLTADTAQGALIEHLRAGEAYFGNPFVWDGRFTLRAGEARMGDVARIETDELTLEFELEPWDPVIRVFLVQGMLGPGPDVAYLHYRTEITGSESLLVDTKRSCFVRLEAYSAPANLANRWAIVILTNPILFLRD